MNVLIYQKIKTMKLPFIALSVYVLTFKLIAQVQDISFNVQSHFQPIIKASNKISDNPEVADTIRKIKNFQYSISSFPIYKKFQLQPITFAKYKDKYLWNGTQSYIKAGYGFIYNMPLFEVYLGSRNSKNLRYGVYYNLLASDKQLKYTGYSGYTDHIASAFAEKYIDKHFLKFNLNYSNNKLYNYGFDTSLNKISDKNMYRLQYYYWSPSISIKSNYNDSSKLNHEISISYYNLQNYQNARENNIKLNVTLNKFIYQENFFLDLSYDYYNHKITPDTLNNHIFSLSPYFISKNENIEIKVGIKTTMDALYSSKFYFYPVFYGNYNLYQHLIEIFAGVDGGLYKNSIKSLSDENPYINTIFYTSGSSIKNLHLTNSNRALNVFAGFKGKLSSNADYILQGSYEQWDSLYYFNIYFDKYLTMNNQYQVNYDNTKLFTLNAQMKYNINSRFNISASGTYFYYQLKNFSKPYLKPLYKAQISAQYFLNDNIIFKFDGFLYGERWARVITDGISVQSKLLPAIPDLNFTTEYKRNKKLSVFITFNNIANLRYYKWYNYPSQRFNLMLGFTYIPF